MPMPTNRGADTVAGRLRRCHRSTANTLRMRMYQEVTRPTDVCDPCFMLLIEMMDIEGVI